MTAGERVLIGHFAGRDRLIARTSFVDSRNHKQLLKFSAWAESGHYCDDEIEDVEERLGEEIAELVSDRD